MTKLRCLLIEFFLNKFLSGSLIRFIEDYDDCIKVRNYVLRNSQRLTYEKLFIHQIRLSKSKEQAIGIIKEAHKKGYNISIDWSNEYNTFSYIRQKQEEWVKGISNHEYEKFYKLYANYLKMKSNYLGSLTIERLKAILGDNHHEDEVAINKTQTSNYLRSIYIKEYAKSS